jgi:uncharacterized protein
MSEPSSPTETAPIAAKVRRRSATRRVFLRLCGAALAAGLGVAADAHVIEPYAIETTRHDAFLPDLPPGLDGVTLAHLTDLHRGTVTPDEVLRQALRLVRDLQPDLVALTGDFVDAQPSDAVQLAAMMGEEWDGFRPPLGVWGVLGNHDYSISADDVAAAIERAGVRILRNGSARTAKGLYVAGIEDTLNGEPDHDAALRDVPRQGAATLFLTHNPTGVFGVARRQCLALAGHTHGGQVRIPGMSPHLPPGMDGFPLVAGWGIFDQARLYVNRGVGMVALPIRFRCRPEIAVITLRRGDRAPRQLPGLTEKAMRKAARAARRALHAIT